MTPVVGSNLGHMNSDCLFCRLVRGDLPSHRVYEDDDFVVLLTIHPINPGHAMVVPKAHIDCFYQMEDRLYIPMMLLVKRLANAIKGAFTPLQVVMETSGVGNRHVHVHVLPVYGLYGRVPQEALEAQAAHSPPAEELAKVARTLTAYMGSS
jgi:histidine triad (HIT) family protein